MTAAPDPSADVHEGSDGWLFLVGGTNRVLEQYGRPGLPRRLFWQWRRIVSDRVRACARLGATYVHAVAPEKLTVYGDRAPDLVFDPARAPVRRLARWLTASAGARAFVDLDRAFREAREGPPLYLRTDSHWTLHGSEVAYRAILSRMGVAPRDDFEARRTGGTTHFSGDLGRKLAPIRTEHAPVITFATQARRIHANGLLTELEAQGRGMEVHLGAHVVFRNDDRQADPRCLVIFGDSFCQHTAYNPVATLTALLADRFREVHFLWSTSIDWHYLERVRPDFVLGEIAERFMIDLPPRTFRIERLAELARARKGGPPGLAPDRTGCAKGSPNQRLSAVNLTLRDMEMKTMIGSRDVERLNEVIASYDKPTVPAAYSQYFSKHHASVQGWLFTPIMTALGVIVDAQTRAGYEGGFAEIGVHHGRFYCALAMVREGGWRGIAIDIFEDQHLNPDGSGKGSLQVFKGNMQRLGLDPAQHTIVQSDSKIVPADRIRSAVGGDGVLVFSVDGAHTVDYTVADLDLAAQSLHPCGVIILDDVFNPRWPGVIEGALNWLNGASGSSYEMIAYGNNKGFIAHRDVAPAYRSLLSGPPGIPVSDNDAVVIAGRPSLSCRFSEPSEIFLAEGAVPAAASRVLHFGRRGNGLRALRDGWSKPEPHGTWSSAARARLAIGVGRDWALRTCRIELHTLLPSGQSQHLKVFQADREVASLDLTGGKQTIDVPLTQGRLNDEDTMDLTFETAHVFNPFALGLSKDNRDLGILLNRITLSD